MAEIFPKQASTLSGFSEPLPAQTANEVMPLEMASAELLEDVKLFFKRVRAAGNLVATTELTAQLERRFKAALLAAERRGAAEERRADVCGVCCAGPLASGRPCICGGVGTADAERQGLRRYIFDLESELEGARAVIERAREYVEASKRYESELKHDYSGQLACGTRMLVVDTFAALRGAVDALPERSE